jgi:hypothetical protein
MAAVITGSVSWSEILGIKSTDPATSPSVGGLKYSIILRFIDHGYRFFWQEFDAVINQG